MTITHALFTLGHSNRSTGSLLEIICNAQVSCVVDVRAVPHSTRCPQFSQDTLRSALNAAQVTYHWAGRALGGRRSARPDSLHEALQDAASRGFADHMDTPEFARGIAQLLNLAQREPTAILCAEHMPEHCHRRLIADALVLRGMRVIHLLAAKLQREHVLSAEVRRESTTLIYDRHTTRRLDLQ
ncbi:MAG: DUF488 domain-containing protein [Gammaproteobacteria bacterium]|nr:DUF488 domain-containing protein [Gammaproteobacteria bacterium]